jgi:hypothetical protein
VPLAATAICSDLIKSQASPAVALASSGKCDDPPGLVLPARCRQRAG